MSTSMSSTTKLPSHEVQNITLNEGFFSRRSLFDWLFALLAVVGGVYALMHYNHAMDVYEKAILIGTIPCVIWLGWFWRPAARLMLGVAVVSLLAIWLYGGDLQRSEDVFLLKYFISSQSAILWMCMLFFMSTLFYWIGMFTGG